MKIFSWVHRQFNQNLTKKHDHDKVLTLVENEAFVGSCGWNEGILAIGTLGLDLIQPKEDDIFMNNNTNQAVFFDDGEEEMECPLVLNASKHGFDQFHQHDVLECDEAAKLRSNCEQDVVAKDTTKSGQRITLADLLRADSENNLFRTNELSHDHKIKDNNLEDNKTGIESMIKSFVISKKLFKDDSAAKPIKKTKQLMRKILRKKIHPDIGIQKKETPPIVYQGMVGHAT